MPPSAALGEEIYKGLAVFGEHLGKLGKSLGGSVESFQRRWLPWNNRCCRPRAASRDWVCGESRDRTHRTGVEPDAHAAHRCRTGQRRTGLRPEDNDTGDDADNNAADNNVAERNPPMSRPERT